MESHLIGGMGFFAQNSEMITPAKVKLDQNLEHLAR